MTFSYIISFNNTVRQTINVDVMSCTDYKKSLLQVRNTSCESEFSAFACKQHHCASQDEHHDPMATTLSNTDTVTTLRLGDVSWRLYLRPAVRLPDMALSGYFKDN